MNDETAIATLGKVQTPGPQTAGEVLVQAVGRRWAGIPTAPSPQAVSRLRRWPSPIRPPRPQPAAGRSTPPPPPARHPGASTVRDTGHPAIAAVGGSPTPAATRSPSGPPTRPDAGRTLRAAVPHPRQPLLRGISSPPASGAAAGGRSRRSLCPAGTRRRHDAAAVGPRRDRPDRVPSAQPRASGTPGPGGEPGRKPAFAEFGLPLPGSLRRKQRYCRDLLLGQVGQPGTAHPQTWPATDNDSRPRSAGLTSQG